MGRVWASIGELVRAVRAVQMTPQFLVPYINGMLAGNCLPLIMEFPVAFRRELARQIMLMYNEDDDAMERGIRILTCNGIQVSLARVQRWCISYCFWQCLDRLALDPDFHIE